ncbi:MAG TPA: aryl-sulfate sulfotransferase [Candidatus Binatia bacterium]|nr:aryl-sulfate sulfotransferase [Candidatus Binatia bacterium]
MDSSFVARASRLATLVVASWLIAVPASGGEAPAVEFLSPRPGAAMILPETNLIVRPGGLVTGSGSECLRVTGSVSGPHTGTLRLCDDRRTVIFQPDHPFVASETVTCRLDTGLSTDTRGPIAPGDFSFTIAGPEREALRDQPAPADVDEDLARALASGSPPGNASSAAPAESLPFDFPAIHADVPGAPAPGRLFVSDLFFNIRGPRIPSYLMILENDGTPYWYRQIDGVGLDFKMQPDGRLTYFDSAHDAFYAMDARYAVVDSFRCGNGYSTDNHDLLLLPNGHAVLMSADPQVMDLSALGGYPNAVVIGLIIQELDQAKNVVFQWRSWDHFQITDMIFHRIDAPVVDYVHGNSIDVDPEGNFILSSRHMNEVTKISRATGEILWRLGGKNNQFRFVNEPIAFSHQHHVRLLPDGHLTMFDNGNFRVPQFSRAVEYAIDETNRTATLAWQYRLTPDVFGVAFGSVQRLPNGNTLIGWGATQPTLTEVDPGGQIVSRLSFDSGVASYRSFRFEWPPVKPAAIAFDPSTLALDPATGQDPERGTLRARIAPVDSAFSVADVIVPSVRLNGSVPADTTSAQADRDGLVLLFARDEVEPLLAPGTNRLEVTGSLTTGERFRGSASIEAVGTDGRRDSGAPPKVVSAPGKLPVELRAAVVSGKRRTFAVFDIHGRLVRRGEAPAGAARISWDGRDRAGRPAASGVYLIRVEDGSSRSAAKVAIVR